jgi:hypothetical protein
VIQERDDLQQERDAALGQVRTTEQRTVMLKDKSSELEWQQVQMSADNGG